MEQWKEKQLKEKETKESGALEDHPHGGRYGRSMDCLRSIDLFEGLGKYIAVDHFTPLVTDEPHQSGQEQCGGFPTPARPSTVGLAGSVSHPGSHEAGKGRKGS